MSVTTRERLAIWLNRVGALSAMMRLRQLAPVPSMVSIVTYHHIADDDLSYAYDPGVADASPSQFRRQMELLARWGTPIGIDELLRAVDGAPLPNNAVMVTFDDGYRSCHDVALPILRDVGMPATFFIATSFIAERRLFWWEKIALVLSRARRVTAELAYPKPFTISARDPRAHLLLTDVIKDTPGLDVDRFLDQLFAAFGVDWSRDIEARHANELVMTWDHVRALARAGMGIESHGRRHLVLQTLDGAALRDELEGSRHELEAEIGGPVRALAYPVGRRIANAPHVRNAAAEAGYRLGFSNASGTTRLWPGRLRSVFPVDPFDVKRLSTERAMTDAMYFTQVALPPLAYIGRNNQ
jgi:peptidoglycan/xylan/chitin deacetylase (PgdA/CDA1 family)